MDFEERLSEAFIQAASSLDATAPKAPEQTHCAHSAGKNLGSSEGCSHSNVLAALNADEQKSSSPATSQVSISSEQLRKHNSDYSKDPYLVLDGKVYGTQNLLNSLPNGQRERHRWMIRKHPFVGPFVAGFHMSSQPLRPKILECPVGLFLGEIPSPPAELTAGSDASADTNESGAPCPPKNNTPIAKLLDFFKSSAFPCPMAKSAFAGGWPRIKVYEGTPQQNKDALKRDLREWVWGEAGQSDREEGRFLSPFLAVFPDIEDIDKEVIPSMLRDRSGFQSSAYSESLTVIHLSPTDEQSTHRADVCAAGFVARWQFKAMAPALAEGVQSLVAKHKRVKSITEPRFDLPRFDPHLTP